MLSAICQVPPGPFRVGNDSADQKLDAAAAVLERIASNADQTIGSAGVSLTYTSDTNQLRYRAAERAAAGGIQPRDEEDAAGVPRRRGGIFSYSSNAISFAGLKLTAAPLM